MKKFLGSFENRAQGSSLQRGVCLKLHDCACSTPVTASVRVKAQLLMTAFSHHRLRMTDCKSLTSSITNRTVGTIFSGVVVPERRSGKYFLAGTAFR